MYFQNYLIGVCDMSRKADPKVSEFKRQDKYHPGSGRPRIKNQQNRFATSKLHTWPVGRAVVKRQFEN